MKKLLNLMLLVAMAIGFASCEQTELSDNKYQNKLVGEWSATTIKGVLVKDGVVIEEQSKNIPDGEMYESIVYNFKKDGTFDEIVVEADGDRDVENGKYSVTDGKLILSYLDDSDEPVQLDIVDISKKKLVLKLSEPYSLDTEMIMELYLEKL